MSNTSHRPEGVCDERATGLQTFEGEVILCADSPSYPSIRSTSYTNRNESPFVLLSLI